MLERNITKVFYLNAAWMFLVALPVIVPYFQGNGLTMEQVYQLQTLFALTLVFLDVPLGYVADLLGRKQCLVAAGVLNGVAFLVLAFARDFTGFACFELLCAVGSSLFSGCDVAIVYDSLAALPPRKEADVILIGKKVFYAQIGETLAALLASGLVLYSSTLPAKVNAVTAWIPFLIALTLHEPPIQKPLDRSKHWENMRHIFVSLFRQSRLLTLIILNNIAYGVCTLLAVWAFQAYWGSEKVPIQLFGYLWAISNLTVALTGRFAHRIEQAIGSANLVLLIGVLPMIGFFGMGLWGGALGVACGITFQICRGLNQVILKDALNARVPASMRATANSVTSLGVRFVFAFLGPLMGYLIDRQGMRMALYVFGGIYGFAFLGLCLPLLAQRRSFRPVVAAMLALAFLSAPSDALAARRRKTLKDEMKHEMDSLLVKPPEDLETCFSPEEPCDVKLTKFIDQAQVSLDIAVYDINLDEVVSHVLAKASRIPVRIIVDRKQAKGPKSAVPQLIRAGANVRFGTQRGVMHNKFIIVDGKAVETGSFNQTYGAASANEENQVYLMNPKVVDRYKDRFEKIWRKAKPAKRD